MKIPDVDTLKSMSLEEFAEYISKIPVSERQNLELDFSVLGEEKKYLLEVFEYYEKFPRIAGICQFNRNFFSNSMLNELMVSKAKKREEERVNKEAKKYATRNVKNIKIELDKIETEKELKNWYLGKYSNLHYFEELDKDKCFFYFLHKNEEKDLNRIKKYIIRAIWFNNYLFGLSHFEWKY